MKLTLITILFIIYSSASLAEVTLCKDVEIKDLSEFQLTESEEILLCGDEKSKTYVSIPLYQKQLYLTGYLQARSYLNPTFSIGDKKLIVNANKRFHVKKINVLTDHTLKKVFLEKRLRRKFKGELLNPASLNAIEADTKELFKRYGHACIKPVSEFFIDTEVANINLESSRMFVFPEIKKEEIPGILPNALERFYPFSTGEIYNSRLIELTEKRMIRSDVVQATYFTDNCLEDPQELELNQFFITGPPRTIKFGIGASTELGPMFRFRWNNHRYGEMASRLGASLELSARIQTATLRSEQFLWKEKPRRSIINELTLSREDQQNFEETGLNFDNLIKWSADKYSKFFAWGLGPSYEYGYYSTVESVSTKSYSNIYLKSFFKFMAHDYEYYDIHPEEGNIFDADIEYRSKYLGFNTEVLRMDTSYTRFYRLFHWGKGSVIGGFRSLLGTSVVSDKVSLNSLPPVTKFYAGGTDDIRGFGLKHLPRNNGQGGLTRFGMKWELRKTHFIIPSLESFVFSDFAFIGEESWRLEKKRWVSVGAGLRWLSPIGMVQTFLANSYQYNPDENLGPYGYIGLGGTF